MISNADRREYRRIFRLAFPEHVRELERNAAARYPERNRNKTRLFRIRHLETLRKFDRNRYHARFISGYFRRSAKRHYAKHKESYLFRWAKRNAIKKGATIGSKKAIERVYQRASELRQWFDVVVDHIIPLSKGGPHCTSNLQIIYRKDNERKNCRLDYKPSVIFS